MSKETEALLAARRVFLTPGTVTELRILNTTRGTMSGYFDDPAKLAAAAAQWSGKAPGIYVTANPVNPALLARAHNRVVAYAKHTTGDNDIIRRHWLLIDCDPVRPPGISATEAEHDAALDRAREICAWVRSLGFSALILADSGNGGHVLAAIDLPNDAESTALVKRCLEAVALRFSDDAVAIDLSVYNPARIWKVYGTLACKGDSTPDRPHRLARMLDVPDELAPTPRELLEKLAALAPEEPKAEQRQSYTGYGAFDLGRWIADHTLAVRGPSPWQGGRKWIFSTCPWNADHTNHAAYLIQFASGAIAAGCHHNGCYGKDWHALRDVIEPGWREKRSTQAANGQAKETSDPWDFAKPAPDFLAEEEKEFQGLAKDLLAPGAVTLLAAPRGLGKTQVSHALAVALATGGVFRGERVHPVRVLLLDRDNPESIIKKRLGAWGAAEAPNLRVLTRQHAPDLKDKTAWAAFPANAYDVLIMDSVGASTEGVTEKEGKQTTEILATILDLARQGPGLLLLMNCTKDALTLKGRGDWADRADIVYEVRDATGFTPSGKKSWWQELPEAGEAAWAERAARRKGRINFRLAFVPSKFRLGVEPEPFCIELHLPEGELWTLRDVTDDIMNAGEEVVAKAERAKNEKLEKAAAAMAEVVKDRAATDAPILKTEAEEYLYKEQHLSRPAARSVISEKENVLWRVKQIKTDRGRPKALYPVAFQTDERRKSDPSETPDKTRPSEEPISAGTDSRPGGNILPLEPAKNSTSGNTLFPPPHFNTTAEIGAQKSPSNGGCGDTPISAGDEVEKQESDAGVI